GFAAVWAALINLVWSIPGLMILLGVFGTLLFRYRPQWSWRIVRQPVPDHLRLMHRELARLDRQARQHGFERAPHETLSHFAARLRQSNSNPWAPAAADCYELYVDLRYRGRTGLDAVQQLRQATSRIPAPKTAGQAG